MKSTMLVIVLVASAASSLTAAAPLERREQIELQFHTVPSSSPYRLKTSSGPYTFSVSRGSGEAFVGRPLDDVDTVDIAAKACCTIKPQLGQSWIVEGPVSGYRLSPKGEEQPIYSVKCN